MTFSAKAIANYFIDLEGPRKRLTPLQIQKLVYFAHGWNLAIKKEPLIDEPIQAWEFGPAVPSLYHEFKNAGSGPILAKARDWRATDDDTVEFFEPNIKDEGEVEFTEQLLRKIWSTYGHYSGIQLSNLTHKEGTPWTRAREEFGNVKHVNISDAWIREYFESIGTANQHVRK